MPSSQTTITLTTDCSDGSSDVYVLGTSNDWFFQTGLVRQGHTMTQLSLTALVWDHAVTGATQNFGQGEMWIELSTWGDSVAVELAWFNEHDLVSDTGVTCTADVVVSLESPDIAHGSGMATATLGLVPTETNGGRVSLLLQARPSDGKLVGGAEGANDDLLDDQVTVVTTTSGAQVATRTATRDVFVEIPTNSAKCGYSAACANIGVITVAVEATNPSSQVRARVRACVRSSCCLSCRLCF